MFFSYGPPLGFTRGSGTTEARAHGGRISSDQEGGNAIPVAIKRVYEKPSASDGRRILVDGLWPRGFSKNALKIEKWLKEVAPSAELRKWYGHQPERWEEFQRRYQRELKASPRKKRVEEIVRLARRGKVTLVFAAKDAERANAAVLREVVSAAL